MTPTREAVEEELVKLTHFKLMAKAPVLCSLLEHVVRKALNQDPPQDFREVVIGETIYGNTYNPMVSPKVRVAFRRLREAVKHYYQTEGHPNLVHIVFGDGYHPTFEVYVEAHKALASADDAGIEACFEIHSTIMNLCMDLPFGRYYEIESQIDIATCLLSGLIGMYREGAHEIFFTEPARAAEEAERRMWPVNRYFSRLIEIYKTAEDLLQTLNCPSDNPWLVHIRSTLPLAAQFWSRRAIYADYLKQEAEQKKKLPLPPELEFSLAGWTDY